MKLSKNDEVLENRMYARVTRTDEDKCVLIWFGKIHSPLEGDVELDMVNSPAVHYALILG